nr:hypothetical protein [Morchella crassipes]
MGGVRGWLGRTPPPEPPPRTPPPPPPPCIPPPLRGEGDERVLGPPNIPPPPSEMGGRRGAGGGGRGCHTASFSQLPPPTFTHPPPHHYPKGPWPSVKGRKSPPLSPQIFIFKIFPRPLRRPSGTARGKKIKKWKEGRPPPPFQTITHVVVMKRGDLEKGGRGPWVVGGKVEKKFVFIIKTKLVSMQPPS